MTDQDRRARTVAWFTEVRDRLCAAFEALEDRAAGPGATERTPGRFVRTPWRRAAAPGEATAAPSADLGGGEMAILRGRVFEKVGVNLSVVHGRFDPAFRDQIPGAAASDGAFWAAGVSVVAHMCSPHVPATHMNTRHLATDHGWFGGGADLTPTFADPDAVAAFKGALKAACGAHDPAAYDRYAAWCDRYFYLPHRAEPRGAGGIFFDELTTANWEADFAFVRAVGQAFLEVFPAIVAARMDRPWTAAERAELLAKRGRYVEFNLLYDRGTVFGLKTGGNPEAVLMSLPPMVTWP